MQSFKNLWLWNEVFNIQYCGKPIPRLEPHLSIFSSLLLQCTMFEIIVSSMHSVLRKYFSINKPFLIDKKTIVAESSTVPYVPWVKANFFQKGYFYIEGSHFYKVNSLLCIFLDYFPKYFLLKLKLFRHHSHNNKYLFRNATKSWKKVGIHFYENILSEIILPIMVSAYGPQLLF